MEKNTQEIQEEGKIKVVPETVEKNIPQNQQLLTKIAELEKQRTMMAAQEIAVILKKYNVKLQGVVEIPTTDIQIVPAK